MPSVNCCFQQISLNLDVTQISGTTLINKQTQNQSPVYSMYNNNILFILKIYILIIIRCKHVPSLTKHKSFKYNCSHMIVFYSIFNVLRISNHLYFKYTHLRSILEHRLTKSVNSFKISIIKTKANISYLFVNAKGTFIIQT
jgi:hypothetical protein